MIKYKTHETENPARGDDERQDVRDGKSTRRRTQDGKPPACRIDAEKLPIQSHK